MGVLVIGEAYFAIRFAASQTTRGKIDGHEGRILGAWTVYQEIVGKEEFFCLSLFFSSPPLFVSLKQNSLSLVSGSSFTNFIFGMF